MPSTIKPILLYHPGQPMQELIYCPDIVLSEEMQGIKKD